MTQPQEQKTTAGQILDRSRSVIRSRCYPARTTKWTFTAGGVAESGTYSFLVQGVLVSFVAVVPTDTNPIIAQGLTTNFLSLSEAMQFGYPTVAGAVGTVEERIPGFGFTLTDSVSPGAATLALADATDPDPGDLPLGVGVALVDTDGGLIRRLGSADTAANVFGVVVESPEMKANTGNPADSDGYAEGSQASLILQGEVPVQVEEDILITDDVWVRKTAAGAEVSGAFRTDADGGDAVQLTNARWLTPSYLDLQGRKTANLLLKP